MPVFHESQSFSAYNRGAMILHWLMALLIITQLIGGYAMMHSTELEKTTRLMFFQLHKTFGILLLLLAVLRILWRLFSKAPSPLPLTKTEKLATHFVVFLFYALMLLVPLAGWALASLYPSRTPLMLFGNPNFVWPFLPLNPNAEAFNSASFAHAVLAYCFIGLLVLHICGALKHQFYDKMPIMARLMPTRKFVPVPAKKSVFAVLLLFVIAGSTVFLYYKSFTLPGTKPSPILTADEAIQPTKGTQPEDTINPENSQKD